MNTLRQAVELARAEKRAIGHFNISDSNQFNAIITAAQNTKLPVIIGVSEGERKFIGVKNVAAMVKAQRDAGMEIYLNADHTYSVEACKEVIDAGFDAVIFDGSALSYEENIAKTREVVAYARASGHDILVEAELGRIGTSSKILDAVPENVDKDLTTPEHATQFVRETGVDMLAPAVGNMHGVFRSGAFKKLDTALVERIQQATGVPLVLHGGSHSTDDDFKNAVKNGMSIVHINTDIRIAYRKGVEEGLKKDADEVAPYRYLAPGVDGVRTVVERYLNLFAMRI